MARDLKDFCRRVEEFYRTTTGRLGYPTCQSLRDTEYPELVEELERLNIESTDQKELITTHLEEALANLESQLESYEALNRRWNLGVRPPDLRSRLT
ncbi:MAG: hypothetical protein O6916_02640 [bacterium]|nr:hypothetical protein [bacterium]MCZ6700236.1 hypothetical protein [bacterium]